MLNSSMKGMKLLTTSTLQHHRLHRDMHQAANEPFLKPAVRSDGEPGQLYEYIT